MLTIAMDTSNDYLSIGLYEDGVLVDAVQEYGSRRQSEYAIPRLEDILKRQNKTLMDIDDMVITRGPGSYTGVRVAMTIAKTMAVISDMTIRTVSSLAAFNGEDSAIVVLDARSGKMYVAVYENGKEVLPEDIRPLEEFAEIRAKYPDLPVLGAPACVGLEASYEPVIHKNMMALAKDAQPVEVTDALVPTYIKKVEAKKQCL